MTLNSSLISDLLFVKEAYLYQNDRSTFMDIIIINIYCQWSVSSFGEISKKHICCKFWPAFGYCAPKTLVEILIFIIFCVIKLKKCKKSSDFIIIFSKKLFFSLLQNAGRVFFPRLRTDYYLIYKLTLSCNLQVTIL